MKKLFFYTVYTVTHNKQATGMQNIGDRYASTL